jgi:hypothetical protein
MHLLFKASLLVGGVVALAVIAGLLYLRQDKFGRLPEGDRLARIGGSATTATGQFLNQVPIVRSSPEQRAFRLDRVPFQQKERHVPPAPIPAVKNDLRPWQGQDGSSGWGIRPTSSGWAQDELRRPGVFSANASPVPLTTRALRRHLDL